VAASQLRSAVNIVDVADVLEVHPGHLKYWLYGHPGHGGYVHYQIPKKNGSFRDISVPPKPISILQKKLKVVLDEIYHPKNCVSGFVKERSIVYGAERHKKKSKWILNIDLQDYYPSINFGRIRGLFISIGIGPKAASVLSHLVTCNQTLPQGASTSPVIANMISLALDNRIMHLCSKYMLRYTRYADDITLSSSQRTFPTPIASTEGTGLLPANVVIGSILREVIESSGFVINSMKTRLYNQFVRQEVTGLTVNEFVNVKRGFIRQIRAMINAIEKFGLEKASEEYIDRYIPPGKMSPEAMAEKSFDSNLYFLNVVYGKLAYLSMVRGDSDRIYVNFCLKMNDLDPSPPKQIKDVVKMFEEFEVFICHASEDKEAVAEPLYDSLDAVGIKAFLDKHYIKWGDSFVEKINHALSRAKLVIVILSLDSVDKAWPKKEINSSIAREIDGHVKILPLLVGDASAKEKILKDLPLLADKLYKSWSGDANALASDIAELLGKS
jgi:retron-type reverse transcriptase